jgi:hypothetical protein
LINKEIPGAGILGPPEVGLAAFHFVRMKLIAVAESQHEGGR